MSTCPTCKTTYPDTMRLCPTDGTVLEGALAPKDDNVGRTLDGKYRLDKKLNSGGMGVVYKATHLMLGKAVAVKLIKADLPASPDVVRRFQREAKAASALNHPNIAPAYDLGQTQDGTLYIAMEYIDGQSLKDVIQAGPIDPAHTINILKQVASALSLAHKHDIIHRDLKPQNIMLTTDADGRQVAKLLDFGIAKTLDDSATQLTATGFSLGTPQYMSPEQAYGRPVDGRSDLYSLGIILYEMLVGEVPFSDPSTPAVLVKQMTEMPVPPELKRPDLKISPELAAIALRCLEKDPAKRYQTADEFSAALDAAAASLGAVIAPLPQPAAGAGTGAAATLVLGKEVHSQTTRMPTPVPIAVPAPPTDRTLVVGSAPPAAAAATTQIVTSKVDPTAPAKTAPAAAPVPAVVPVAVAPAKPAPVPTPAPAKAGSGSRAAVAVAAAVILLGGGAYGAFRLGLIGGAQGGSVTETTHTATATTAATTPPTTQLASSGVPAATAPASTDPAGAAAAGGGGTPSSPATPGGTGAPPAGGNGSGPTLPPSTSAPSAATPPPMTSPGRKAGNPVMRATANNGPSGSMGASGPGSTGMAAASSGAPSGSSAPSQSTPAAPAADPLPANPSVAFRCDGAPDICAALKSAVDQALAKDSMSSVRDASRADIALGATVTLIDEQTQKMFGTTFTVRNYTIDVNGDARRTNEAVPMPSATTLNYDARYRDRLDEKARLVAASVVENIRGYWKKR